MIRAGLHWTSWKSSSRSCTLGCRFSIPRSSELDCTTASTQPTPKMVGRLRTPRQAVLWLSNSGPATAVVRVAGNQHMISRSLYTQREFQRHFHLSVWRWLLKAFVGLDVSFRDTCDIFSSGWWLRSLHGAQSSPSTRCSLPTDIGTVDRAPSRRF